MVSPAMKQRALWTLLKKGVSRRLGCIVVGLSRSASRRQRSERRPELKEEILRLSAENPRYGFRRIHALVGPGVNLKAVHRIWRAEGLSLRVRKRKRIHVEKVPQETATAFGDVWSIDFATEWLENRRQARIVGMVDVATRQCLLLKARPSIRAADLVKELSWLFLVHGKPKKIRFDNGPEFRSHTLTEWLTEKEVETGFIEPGSPWQNGHIESFFGKLRDELLNMTIFPTGEDLGAHLDEYLEHYNQVRPHSSLGNLTPSTYKEKIKIYNPEAETLTL
jgi:putative transposase